MDASTFVTRLYEQSGGPPTFFEVLAQEKLLKGLHGAYKFLVDVIITRYPQFAGKIPLTEVAFWTIRLLAEYYFLSHNSASMSEKFYGLRRTELHPPPGLKNSKKLSQKTIFLSLFFLVITPLLKEKIHEWHKKKLAQHPLPSLSSHSPTQSFLQTLQSPALTFRQKLNHLLIHINDYSHSIYPYLYSTITCIDLMYHLRYLLSPYRNYTPALVYKLTGTLLVKAQEGETIGKETNLAFLRKLVFSLLHYSVFGFLHSIRFIEWYYANESKLQPKNVVTSIPPPPPVPSLDPMFPNISLPVDSKICPLCETPITNPACSASGYVFCYPCIVQFVRTYSRCPLTKVPTSETQVRRLFPTFDE